MTDSQTDPAKRQAVASLAEAGSLLLVTHRKPDGDGLGSMVALARAARATGRRARCVLADEVPPRYRFLTVEEDLAGLDELSSAVEGADRIVVLDTSAPQQLDGLADALAACTDKTLVIDHHTQADGLGRVQWVDTTAAAVGVMTCELLDALDWPVDARSAEALMVAIVSDTGWLRHSNTDGRTLRTVADLVERGVSMADIYDELYQHARVERLHLMQRMLGSLRLDAAGRLATMVLRQVDFAETGARADETEDLINEAMRIGSVELAILLVEQSTGPVRVSFRSRREVDVADLARRFGGGGHARAAGARIDGDGQTVRRLLIDAAGEALARSASA